MCVDCRKTREEIHRLQRAMQVCPCPVKYRPLRSKYWSEYYQRHKEKINARAKERYHRVKNADRGGNGIPA